MSFISEQCWVKLELIGIFFFINTTKREALTGVMKLTKSLYRQGFRKKYPKPIRIGKGCVEGVH